MRRIKVEQSAKETYTAHPGLALVGRCIGLCRDMREQVGRLERGRHGLSSMDILTCFLGLLCLGKSDYEAVAARRGDAWFKEALGLDRVPSPECLRQRLDEMARNEALVAALARGSLELLRRLRAPVTGYGRDLGGMVALDIDVTPQDNSHTKKEGVEYTYKGFCGYAPIVAYLGFEGWCVDLELRPGSQHAQHGFVEFLRGALAKARCLTKAPLLVRLDSAHDAAKTLRALEEAEGVHYVIRWNPRGSVPELWLERARAFGVEERGHRAGVRSWLVEIADERPVEEGSPEVVTCRRVVRVTEERIDEAGRGLLFPRIHLEGWLTDLSLPAQEVIRLYREHGTSEQFHSELKGELDLERLPSGFFATNALVLRLGGFAYNLLRALGVRSLSCGGGSSRGAERRRRVRTVMRELVWGAARLIQHSHSLVLRFSRYCPGYGVFCRLLEWLDSMRQSEYSFC